MFNHSTFELLKSSLSSNPTNNVWNEDLSEIEKLVNLKDKGSANVKNLEKAGHIFALSMNSVQGCSMVLTCKHRMAKKKGSSRAMKRAVALKVDPAADTIVELVTFEPDKAFGVDTTTSV